MIPKFANKSATQPGGADGAGADLRSVPASALAAAAGLLRRGQAAARNGDRVRARRLLRAALIADPTNTEARLWLAAIAEDPQESIDLLTEVLQDHPGNARAAAGLRWAWDRLEAQALAEGAPALASPRLEPALHRRNRWLTPVVGVLLCLAALLSGAFFVARAGWAQVLHAQSTLTGTPSHSGLPALPLISETPVEALQPTAVTPTATLTCSPTATATATNTPEPTATATATATATSLPPTATALPPTPVPQPTTVPASQGHEGRWIEVNLSTQRLIAWEGDTAVRTMLCSTGLPGTPTVTGSYHIYVKLESTLMTGPGYYLPNVPHTMYFYRGYGIHGAYWHNNFGQPMSHGCVNLSLPDAEWIFDWASPIMPAGARVVYATADNPGTLVVVHY